MSFSDNNFYCDNAKYERSKIGKLRNEREEIQEKTYKNWINSILIQGRTGITDIYTDLASGEKLIILLELLTGEKVGPISQSSSVLHKIANVSLCMKFIESKNVYLESIGASDIVDGNKKLTLGLIWTLILRFQLSKHLDFAQYDLKLIKESLLLWCQNKIKHLQFIKIVDFHKSWQNGWAFVGLVHSFRPESIDIETLNKKENRELLAIAFDTAYQQLLIPKILDVDDVINSPDENSILTYVSYFYNLHSKIKMSETSVKRVKCLLTNLSDMENMQDNYLNICNALLNWIDEKCKLFQQEVDIDCAQEELFRFKNYFFNERSAKLETRNECESLYFEIVSMQKEAKIKPFQPSDGLKVKDLEKSWIHLEQIETERQSKLKDLIHKQEKLVKQSEIFELKSRKFENYIDSKLALLNKIFDSVMKDGQNICIEDLAKHLGQSESICLDIIDNKVKFDSLKKLASEIMLLQSQHKHPDRRFYEQYKDHIDDKLKHLNDMACKNLDTIHLTRQLINDLSSLENLLIELENLKINIELIAIILEPDAIDSMESILVNLEKLKHLEIQLDLLEKDYLECRDRFHLIESSDGYQSCFVLFDKEWLAQKLDNSVDLIDICRETIESYKKKINYQIELNDFYSNIECVNQFLNEKRIITKSNPYECLNSSNIEFIQRRNNMIKLEIRVKQKELCSASKKGYLLMNNDHHPDIANTILTMIENVKAEFKNFIVLINERTLLINDCILLLDLINQLNHHQVLMESLSMNGGNFHQNLKQTIEFYADEMLALGGIYDKLGRLSIHLQEYCLDDVDSKSYIIYLNKYHLDQIDLMDSHAYLICEIDHFPDVRPDHFWTIYLNLFELIKQNKDHVIRLLSMTEFDFDTHKLKQVLDANDVEHHDDDKDMEILNDDQSTKVQNDTINVDEIEMIYKIFFENQNSKELESFLNRRDPQVTSDFANIEELTLIIKHTIRLIETVQQILNSCQMPSEMTEETSEPIESEPELNNDSHSTIQLPSHDTYSTIEQSEMGENLQPNHEPKEVVLLRIDQQAKDDDDDDESNVVKEPISPMLYEQHEPESDLVKKRKIFGHKLRKNIIYIHQYVCEIDDQKDLKFRLKFLAKTIDENVKRIEIFITEFPNDQKSKEFRNLSEKLNKCNGKLVHYQKLSTFKDLLDDFCLNIINNIDNLHCIRPKIIDGVLDDSPENCVRHDMQTIESIQIQHVYYQELFAEFQNGNDSDDCLRDYLNEITLIFGKYRKTMQMTKKFLTNKWDVIQKQKKNKRIEFLTKQYAHAGKFETLPKLIREKVAPKQANVDENFHQITIEKDDFSEMKIKQNNSGRSDDDDNSRIERLLRQLELILFDIQSGINVHKYQKEQIEQICTEIANSTNDYGTMKKLDECRKSFDRILRQKMDQRKTQDFRITSEHFLRCCHDDIKDVDECLQNMYDLPLDQRQKLQLVEKISLLRKNLLRSETIFASIYREYCNTDQAEIRSKLVCMQDVLKRNQFQIDQLQAFSEIDEDFNEASKNIQHISLTVQVVDENQMVTLKELQAQIVTIKSLLDQIDTNMATIGGIDGLKIKSVNRLRTMNKKAAIMVRYKILKYEIDSKLKQFNECQLAQSDRLCQKFMFELMEHRNLFEKVLKNLDLDRDDNLTLLSDALDNWSVLTTKFESFNHLLAVDSFRKKLLEIPCLVLDPEQSAKAIQSRFSDKKYQINRLKSTGRQTMPFVHELNDGEDEIFRIKESSRIIDLSLSDSMLEADSFISDEDFINNNFQYESESAEDLKLQGIPDDKNITDLRQFPTKDDYHVPSNGFFELKEEDHSLGEIPLECNQKLEKNEPDSWIGNSASSISPEIETGVIYNHQRDPSYPIIDQNLSDSSIVQIGDGDGDVAAEKSKNENSKFKKNKIIAEDSTADKVLNSSFETKSPTMVDLRNPDQSPKSPSKNQQIQQQHQNIDQHVLSPNDTAGSSDNWKNNPEATKKPIIDSVREENPEEVNGMFSILDDFQEEKSKSKKKSKSQRKNNVSAGQEKNLVEHNDSTKTLDENEDQFCQVKIHEGENFALGHVQKLANDNHIIDRNRLPTHHKSEPPKSMSEISDRTECKYSINEPRKFIEEIPSNNFCHADLDWMDYLTYNPEENGTDIDLEDSECKNQNENDSPEKTNWPNLDIKYLDSNVNYKAKLLENLHQIDSSDRMDLSKQNADFSHEDKNKFVDRFQIESDINCIGEYSSPVLDDLEAKVDYIQQEIENIAAKLFDLIDIELKNQSTKHPANNEDSKKAESKADSIVTVRHNYDEGSSKCVSENLHQPELHRADLTISSLHLNTFGEGKNWKIIEQPQNSGSHTPIDEKKASGEQSSDKTIKNKSKQSKKKCKSQKFLPIGLIQEATPGSVPEEIFEQKTNVSSDGMKNNKSKRTKEPKMKDEILDDHKTDQQCSKQTPRKIIKAKRSRPKPVGENQSNDTLVLASMDILNHGILNNFSNSPPVVCKENIIKENLEPSMTTIEGNALKNDLEKCQTTTGLSNNSLDSDLLIFVEPTGGHPKFSDNFECLDVIQPVTDSIEIRKNQNLTSKKVVRQDNLSDQCNEMINVDDDLNSKITPESDLEFSPWWQFLTPRPRASSSQKPEFQLDFASMIDWNEIDNAPCGDANTNSINTSFDNVKNKRPAHHHNHQYQQEGHTSLAITKNIEEMGVDKNAQHNESRKQPVKRNRKKCANKKLTAEKAGAQKTINLIGLPMQQPMHKATPRKIKIVSAHATSQMTDGRQYSFIRLLGRLLIYSLPFYLLFLILLLIFLILPKDEDEFNCLRRLSEYEYHLKRVYLNGPPPV